MQNCCIGTIAYDCIKDFEAKKYGRSAWLALIHNYEGTNYENKRLVRDG